MKKICLVTCYMGPLPGYFDYYVASCKNNATIDFIVINDTLSNSYTDQNIRFIKMDLTALNVFASQQLNTRINLNSAWKINELKPLFGIVFKDDLKNYDFWGWCDLDIIWGNIRNFLTCKVLDGFDVITSKEMWTAGHFTLLRNNDLCNNLYKRYTGIIELLNDPKYYAFEECCHRWNGEIFTFDALAAKGLPVSMFDIVKRSETDGELKAHFNELVREHPQPVNYTCTNGVLYDHSTATEFMYYHLITVKKIWRFYIPKYQKNYRNLVMSPYGIRAENENKIKWFFKRTYSCYLGIKKSAKTQTNTALLKKVFRTAK